MSQWLGAIILVVGFVVIIQLLGLAQKSQYVIRIALHSMKIISSSRLSDEQKESKLQKNSRRLFGLFFVIALSAAIAIVVPLGILWLAERLGWLSVAAALETTVSPIFLIASTLLAIAIFYFKPGKKSPTVDTTSSYSQLDRTLHQVAFNTYGMQVSLASLEDRLFSQSLAKCSNERPVFITALPRAGTTLLLECCASSPEFAAHRYSDMPFVLVPCLWNRFSQTFQRQVNSTERAHGDGMQIDINSHEALEEVIWQTFWQRHYHRDRLITWDEPENRDFQEFFAAHMQKIIFLRRHQPQVSTRYVSKNNANIARIQLLPRLFPDSTIVVPFREPLAHANSLLQQHLNFLQIHQADPFAAQYMKAIGHYDFGRNLRPIDFDGWYDRRQAQPHSLAFWLEYWLASYQHLLNDNSRGIKYFNYDRLCRHPEPGLTSLANALECRDRHALIASAAKIRQPRPKIIDSVGLPASVVKRSSLIYAELKNIAIN